MEEKNFLQNSITDLDRAGFNRVAGAEELGRQLLATLRNQKGLSYFTAYTGLQYAYNQLRAESSFVQTSPDQALEDSISLELKKLKRGLI